MDSQIQTILAEFTARRDEVEHVEVQTLADTGTWARSGGETVCCLWRNVSPSQAQS